MAIHPELEAFLATEGRHWTEQIARTGLRDAAQRAAMIARTEVQRAMMDGAMQAYREMGVSYKHLLLAPDDACEICKSAEDDGVIPLDAAFSPGEAAPPFHPDCVIGSTRVSAPHAILSATVRDFTGEFVIIRTASGNELTCTLNHPIATRCGWVPAAELKVGDNVLRSLRSEWSSLAIHPDVDDVPPTIQEITQSFPVVLAAMPAASEDFHGDGAGSDVYVVRTGSLLVDNTDASLFQHVSQECFASGNVPSASSGALDTESHRSAVIQALLPAAHGVMGGGGEPGTLLRRSSGHSHVHGFASAARSDTGFEQATANSVPADAEGFCESLLALSGEVALDEIVSVDREIQSAQVYNLTTSDGWYISNGILTHNCRCAVAPAGVEVAPPQSHLGKSKKKELSAFLLLRALNEDGKRRYLLQKRADGMKHPGTWGLPGGGAHPGETPWEAAVRESAEEAGKLPALDCAGCMQSGDDDSVYYTFVCDCAMFEPGGGKTPEEAAGYGWFSRDEIGDLDLQPNFAEVWAWYVSEVLGKVRRRTVALSGQEEWPAAGGGGRYPHPHDEDDTEIAPGGRPGTEPPRWDGTEAQPRVQGGPGGGGAGRVPVPDDEDDAEEPYARGRPPNAVGKGGAADFTDPNPVEAEHVYLQLAKNFPADAIAWVKRAKWIGPIWMPWDRIDTDDEDKWAASHQPEKVQEFVEQIRDHDGHVAPSVLVQEPHGGRAFIVDGHHRAKARRKLGQRVLAYVGMIDPRDRQAALETHAAQIHSGNDPRNR